MGSTEAATTIVIPVWGRYAGETLLEALASLRTQDRGARIVVVDNASDDPVVPLDGVEVIRSPERLTVGGARNLGLERVQTPYVLFWDADDLMPPGTLAFLEDRLRANSGVIAAAAAIVDDESHARHRWPPPWAAAIARRPRLFAVANAVWSMLPATGATLMRTDVVRDAGGYGDANSGEDWVLGAALTFRGRVELHPWPGRIYRRRVGSLWEQRRSLRHLMGHAMVVDRRLLTGAGVPLWGRLIVPGIAVAQALVLAAARPVARRARALFSHLH